MPLRQTLPGTYSSQFVVAKQSNTNIALNDYIFSNDSAKFGTTGKNYIGLPFPWLRFHILNEGAGTIALQILRVSDGTPLFGTIVGAGTNADGLQFKSVLVPNDNPNGITLVTTKSGTVSLSIVAVGITDSGLLPERPGLRRGAGLGQSIELYGGGTGGGQGSPGGMPH